MIFESFSINQNIEQKRRRKMALNDLVIVIAIFATLGKVLNFEINLINNLIFSKWLLNCQPAIKQKDTKSIRISNCKHCIC